MKMIVILLIIIVLSLLVYFGISFYIANKFIQPKHIAFTEKSDVVGPNATDFSIKTIDNIDLSGWYFKNNAKCAVVLIPGIHQNRISGDYGGMGIAKLALSKGYGVVMYDPRGSGESGGSVIGFGSTEVNDINAVLSYLEKAGVTAQHTAIIGSSLGAITTLQDLDVTHNAGALVVDSAATSIKPLIERELIKEKIPTFLNPGIFLITKIVYGVDIPGVRPIDKVAAYKSKPILFIHGVKDSFIPFSNSEELVRASGPDSRLVAFPNADHVQSFKADPQLYEDEVFSFISQQMPQCK